MFQRSETHRERTLLRVIEQQQRIIDGLINRLMYMANRPWEVPQPPVETEASTRDYTDAETFEFPEMTVLDEAP